MRRALYIKVRKKDRRTDGRLTVTLRFQLDAASVMILQTTLLLTIANINVKQLQLVRRVNGDM